MNTPTKITVSRLFLTGVIVFILLFPFYSIGVTFPKYLINDTLVIDSKYILAGVVFLIASFTDFLDGYLARKNKQITDTGKMLDAIADKVLVNSVLIIFASTGFLHAIIPVIIIARDTITDALKMELASKSLVVAAIKSAKIKTASMMVGVTLMFFYNLPFEFINIRVDLLLIYFATVMSIVSMGEYIALAKEKLYPTQPEEN